MEENAMQRNFNQVHKIRFWSALWAFGFFNILSTLLHAQTRDELVRDDFARLQSDNNWFYDDLEGGISHAKKTGKPLMVVLRCIP